VSTKPHDLKHSLKQ